LKFMVVTKGMYTYTLKVTRHLGHFFYLTTASRSVCEGQAIQFIFREIYMVFKKRLNSKIFNKKLRILSETYFEL
jgi:hypothetical protein